MTTVQTASDLGRSGSPRGPLSCETISGAPARRRLVPVAFYVGNASRSFPAGWLANRIGVRWTVVLAVTGQDARPSLAAGGAAT